jgi:hypothetical protein
MKTKREIALDICDAIQDEDNRSQKLNDYTLKQIVSYCYKLQSRKAAVIKSVCKCTDVYLRKSGIYKCKNPKCGKVFY